MIAAGCRRRSASDAGERRRKKRSACQVDMQKWILSERAPGACNCRPHCTIATAQISMSTSVQVFARKLRFLGFLLALIAANWMFPRPPMRAQPHSAVPLRISSGRQQLLACNHPLLAHYCHHHRHHPSCSLPVHRVMPLFRSTGMHPSPPTPDLFTGTVVVCNQA